VLVERCRDDTSFLDRTRSVSGIRGGGNTLWYSGINLRYTQDMTLYETTSERVAYTVRSGRGIACNSRVNLGSVIYEKYDRVSVVDENDMRAKTHEENTGHYILDME